MLSFPEDFVSKWDMGSRVLLFWDTDFAANPLVWETFAIHKEN